MVPPIVGGSGDVGAVLHAGPGDAADGFVGARPSTGDRRQRRAVTASTRPPAVRRSSPSRVVPAWKTITSSSAAASARPVITSPVRGRDRVALGREHDGHACVVAGTGPASSGDRSRPPQQCTARSLASRGTTTWHSGSPNRTLYSSIFVPSGVSMRPGVEHAPVLDVALGQRDQRGLDRVAP